LELTLSPSAGNTCYVVNDKVIMPTVSTATLKKVDDEAGQTNFNIQVNCGDSLNNIGGGVDAEIIDNNNISNIGNILTNTGSATGVGIRIFNAEDNQPLNMYQKFNFGELSTVANVSSVTKRFYAKYVSTDLNKNSGNILSEVMLNLTYR